jgi:hypothetical protein
MIIIPILGDDLGALGHLEKDLMGMDHHHHPHLNMT